MKNSRKRSNIVPTSIDPRARNALKYDPCFCALIPQLAKKGEFPEQWCEHLQISMTTMYNWANKYEEFDEACRLAWTYLASYWTAKMMRAARGEMTDTKVLMQILQKRFPDTWGHSSKNTCMHYIETLASNVTEPENQTMPT